MRRAFLAFAAFSLAAGSASAQSTNDIAPFSFIPEIPYGLVLHGPIDMRSPLAFKRALQQHPSTSALILQSEGGSVQAALIVAEEIHDRHIKTLIPEGSMCASACSFLFFAGAERLDLGQLGVHQISGSEDIESTQLNLSDILETLAKYDVSSGVITKMLRTPPNDIYIFTPAEVVALSINKTSGAAQPVSSPTATPTDPDQQSKAKQFVLGLVTASSLP